MKNSRNAKFIDMIIKFDKQSTKHIINYKASTTLHAIQIIEKNDLRMDFVHEGLPNESLLKVDSAFAVWADGHKMVFLYIDEDAFRKDAADAGLVETKDSAGTTCYLLPSYDKDCNPATTQFPNFLASIPKTYAHQHLGTDSESPAKDIPEFSSLMEMCWDEFKKSVLGRKTLIDSYHATNFYYNGKIQPTISINPEGMFLAMPINV